MSTVDLSLLVLIVLVTIVGVGWLFKELRA